MLYLSHSPVKGIICERFQLHEVSLDGAGSVTEASSCCKLISSLNLVLEDAGIEEVENLFKHNGRENDRGKEER